MLDLDIRWIDAGESADRLSAATMADLRIVAGDLTLTSHIDRHSHARSITVPLYPIAEWIAAWWWPVFHEHGEWNVQGDASYLERHDLSCAAPGFALPSVVLQPTGRFLDISARRSSPTFSSVEFLAEGTQSISLAEAQARFSDFVSEVIGRLEAKGIEDTALQGDWSAIAQLGEDELSFSRLAGAFGLDPFDTEEEEAAAILLLAERAEPSLRDDLFSLARPYQAAGILESIRQICQDLERQNAPGTWADLSGEIPSGPTSLTQDTPPWQVGYQAARWIRNRLNLNGQPVDLIDDLKVPALDLPIHCDRLAGIVSSRSPACALKARPDVARRFAMARSIGDFLLRSEEGPTLLTTMRTDRQARSRSFAAELLAPAEGLRARLGGHKGWVDSETIDDLAGEFSVSSLVVAHQIQNHGLGRVGP